MSCKGKILAEIVETPTIEQFNDVCDLECVSDAILLPDTHLGYSLPIGCVAKTNGYVVPSWVGFDIGCGMKSVRTTFDPDIIKANAEIIFNAIYEVVPVGFEHNTKIDVEDSAGYLFATDWFNENLAGDIPKQIGTLGGGNHFIEIGLDEMDAVWVTVHSGSRGIGHAVASRYMRLASGTDKAKEGHYGFVRGSKGYSDYLSDYLTCEDFANRNRNRIISRVMSVLSKFDRTGEADGDNIVSSCHNMLEETEDGVIHRKGACKSVAGKLGVVAGNMRDGVYIVRGLENEGWLNSHSHGAGRTISRKKAKSEVDMQVFKEEMRGVVARVDDKTQDEAPYCYKNIKNVLELQQDMIEVVTNIRPIINVKG